MTKRDRERKGEQGVGSTQRLELLSVSEPTPGGEPGAELIDPFRDQSAVRSVP